MEEPAPKKGELPIYCSKMAKRCIGCRRRAIDLGRELGLFIGKRRISRNKG